MDMPKQKCEVCKEESALVIPHSAHDPRLVCGKCHRKLARDSQAKWNKLLDDLKYGD